MPLWAVGCMGIEIFLSVLPKIIYHILVKICLSYSKELFVCLGDMIGEEQLIIVNVVLVMCLNMK